MKRVLRFLLVALALVGIGLATLGVDTSGRGAAEASVMFSFSDVSSNETPPGVLTSTTTFTVSGSQLLIDVDNTSSYEIAQLYFNSDTTLTGLAFDESAATDFNPSWSISGTGAFQTRTADGFGQFNWLIDFGSTTRPGSGLTSLTLDMTGSTLESTIGSTLSSVPPGEIRALAAMKFESGPGGDGAFGAVVPLPGTWLLLGSGLVGLVLIGRRKKGVIGLCDL
jgi:hypothetical protein